MVKLTKGDWGGYRDAGEAYENAMADLKEQLAKYQYGLPDIVDNVRRRAGVLRRAGDKLMDTFWSTIQFTVYLPHSLLPDVRHILGGARFPKPRRPGGSLRRRD